MKRLVCVLGLISVPTLMMWQVLQAYHHVIAREEMENLEILQRDRLEENKRLLGAVTAFDSPERVYRVADEHLGLSEAEPENVLHVWFAENAGESP